MDELLRDLKAIKLPRGRKLEYLPYNYSIGLDRAGCDPYVVKFEIDPTNRVVITIIAKPTPAERRWLMAAMHAACAHVED